MAKPDRSIPVTARPTFKKDLLEMIVSVLVMSFGVVLTVKAQMGASPIVSLPNVLSNVVGLSLGTTVFIVYFILILIEWALIRDRSRILLTLSQLPFTMLFSLFVDLTVWMLGGWVISGPVEQWVLVIVGTAIIGFGCVLEIDANISMLADDGLVLAISQVTKVRLDKVMIIFDICFVASAFIVSYAAFHVPRFRRRGLGDHIRRDHAGAVREVLHQDSQRLHPEGRQHPGLNCRMVR